MSDNPKGYANPQLLITPEELSEELQAPGTKNQALVLLDLRPAESFAAGHIPGACHLDLFGVSLIDTESYAARGVSVDDRAFVRLTRCVGRPDGHRL